MPPNDVVRHDLRVFPRIDFEGESEPMPMPLMSRPPGLALAKPPNDTMITGQVLDVLPYRSVGKMKLFFDPLRSLEASGWVVAPRAFITAGHCVYTVSRGGWIIEASFCPRFNLSCPGTDYKVEAVFTLQGWIDQGPEDRQYDLAACLVTERFAATEPPLAFVVNRDPALEYAAIGYPTKPISTHDFNGLRMWQSFGETQDEGDGLIWAENDLTGGASGGPWIRGGGDDDIVGGLTSARITDDPNLAVSPVFAQGFQNLYDAVKNL